MALQNNFVQLRFPSIARLSSPFFGDQRINRGELLATHLGNKSIFSTARARSSSISVAHAVRYGKKIKIKTKEGELTFRARDGNLIIVLQTAIKLQPDWSSAALLPRLSCLSVLLLYCSDAVTTGGASSSADGVGQILSVALAE